MNDYEFLTVIQNKIYTADGYAYTCDGCRVHMITTSHDWIIPNVWPAMQTVIEKYMNERGSKYLPFESGDPISIVRLIRSIEDYMNFKYLLDVDIRSGEAYLPSASGRPLIIENSHRKALLMPIC